MDEDFQVLEHPSDAGIEARGQSLKQAFESAARGMMSLIVDPGSVEGVEQKPVTVTGTDVENLLVRWLSEILFEFDGNRFLVAGTDIKEISATRLQAVVSGETANPAKHRLRTDIKAVTYHQLSVETTAAGCVVRVFFDL
jgi:SHS2 domain-containing protein